MKIDDLVSEVITFRDDRNWKKFHNPKDIIISLMTEVGELAEHFKFRNKKELQVYINKNKNEIEDELSDVLHNILLLAHELDIDISRAFKSKMKKNEEKYPIKKNISKKSI